MAATLDLSGFYQGFVNRETVTLYGRTGVAIGTVADAKRLGPATKEHAPSDADYLGDRVIWRLPHDNVEPLVADIVPGFFIQAADGIMYTVIEVDGPGNLLKNVWRMACISLRVFNATVTISLPEDVLADDMSPETRQEIATSMQNLTAAFFETDPVKVEYQGQMTGWRRMFKCWLLADPAHLPIGTTVHLDGDDSVYVLEAVSYKKRIDELYEMTLRLEG